MNGLSAYARPTALGLTALLAVAICYLTLTPVRAPAGLPGNDKLYHFIGFAALALPCAVLHPRSLLWVIPSTLVLGAAIEVIQPFVGRARELADFTADASGAAAGAAVGLLFVRLPLRHLAKLRSA